MKTAEKLYFPALDGLRFVGFLLVFLHHLSLYIRGDIYDNFFWVFFRNNGWIGVDIFFALTGFLVTLLLLEERRVYQGFSIKRFLLRRTLRIWPLYYLALFGGFLLPFFFENFLQINNYLRSDYLDQLQKYFLPFVFFLGNWPVSFNNFPDLRMVSQLWAICLDQQFYLFWPVVLLFCRRLKSSLIVSLFLIIIAILTRIYLASIGAEHPAAYANTFSRLDTFMIGSILAFVLFYKPQLLEKAKFLYSNYLQLTILVAFVACLHFISIEDRFGLRNSSYGYTVIALVASYFILCCLKTDSLLTKFLNINFLRYLGKISYGLYIWHILIVELISFLIPVQTNLVLIICALPLTILLASFSYRFFEKPFLRLKLKFN